MNKLTRLALETAIDAGKEILRVFNSDDFGVRIKSDDSPLTEADLKSHQIINIALQETGIPVLSEEGTHQDYQERKEWHHLWIVDPLDGTKEFVKRSGEFTVNIALVETNRPVMGVVFAPYLGCLYWGDTEGAFKAQLPDGWLQQRANDIVSSLKADLLPLSLPKKMTVVASVSHFSKETEQFVSALKERVGDVDLASRGSSLKMCLVAEGSAHIYPRLGPTMEWDTAAGQAVVEAAGGHLLDWQTREAMLYNRSELLNGWFLTLAKGLRPEDYWLI
ncbi:MULTISPECIES: 3'(2'),5'-bisphosphate nucleotidase CysQ [unclassified Carboxylicivirga]|uniref:3'(2'),5'-bisphosphate nucleotidase CysQ n=1 Tax=Carboxylicivirga TaxID=1628153 RepID=UPI003D345229